MKKDKSSHNRKRRIKYAYIRAALWISMILALFLPSYIRYENTGNNMFRLLVNGQAVGFVDDQETADRLLMEARRKIAAASDELVFIEVETSLEGQSVTWGQTDDEEIVLQNICKIMENSKIETLKRSYMVRAGSYTISLADTDEVVEYLESILGKFDETHSFRVNLVADTSSELNLLTTQVVSNEERAKALAQEKEEKNYTVSGIAQAMAEVMEQIEPVREENFASYDLGLIAMDFADKVEIVEAYQPTDGLTPLQEAIDTVTADKEVNTIYTVVSGDTLSEISITTGVPLDKIIELNDSLESENSTIHVGDELIVTITQPGISVLRTEQRYYEEDYDEPIVYIPNDEWYTTQTKVLQQPSAGHREVVATVTYRNDREESREILKEDVAFEAVAKIVERGTKIPPTYIKPLSGGRITSRFGPRRAPTKGASTYHKGVDYATPTGTTIVASCGGVVTKAGWASGYGYVVMIQHSDGRQTRYGHLSKVLVSAGQTVSQGQKIALSGNTGVSTGPHLHFEILIGGRQVNPLDYLSY